MSVTRRNKFTGICRARSIHSRANDKRRNHQIPPSLNNQISPSPVVLFDGSPLADIATLFRILFPSHRLLCLLLLLLLLRLGFREVRTLAESRRQSQQSRQQGNKEKCKDRRTVDANTKHTHAHVDSNNHIARSMRNEETYADGHKNIRSLQ